MHPITVCGNHVSAVFVCTGTTTARPRSGLNLAEIP